MRGYFGIGVINTKTALNIGTLWRSAAIFDAQFLFTVGRRYKQQASDTLKAWRSVPLFDYEDFYQFYDNLPYDCRLVGVEITDDAEPLTAYKHPERAVYLLGAEDHGIPKEALARCHDVVVLPGRFCLNVAVAGSLVMYDRLTKRGTA